MAEGTLIDREIARSFSRRRFAKVVVAALGVTGFAGAGLSGTLALHSDDWDDDAIVAPSGGSGGSGGSGWDDDWVFPSSVGSGGSGSIGGSGGSGGSGWDDWDDD